jgi:hypothetical protein
MEDRIFTVVENELLGLDPSGTMELFVCNTGIVYFPQVDKAVVDGLLTPDLLFNPNVQKHWTLQYGLGVSVCVNSDGLMLRLTEMKRASCSAYENALDEALADPMWVATHAPGAREAMLAQLQDAAFLAQMAWEIAIRLPEAHQSDRWQATTRHARIF